MIQDTIEATAEETTINATDAVGKLWDKLDGWLDAIILKLPNFIVAILVMVLFYFLARGISRLVKRLILKKVKEESIKQIIGQITYAIVLLIGFFVALGVMDLNKVLTSVLAGAGVVGLAIGLALQGTLSNTVSGFILSFLPKLSIGDWIETDSDKGFVTEINLRNVTIKRPDNNLTVIPNSTFVDNPFTNYTINKRSRIIVGCGVGYESDLQMVEDLTVKILGEAFPQGNNEEIEFFFTEFGDSSINFLVRFWADCSNGKENFMHQHKAIKTIKKHFDEADINIPFPIRTLDFGKNDLTVLSNKDG
ncbi:mechanosensitive ion channel family protein [Marinirhabdus gelatinilytica]|uniref:Small conductance mechanosensitive channel n=1 Tax=Marinirhabdus gelatinilytica TaxID=1703343 RepID=A0A370QA34_9FLAO|nr:mechanosensitive ion channel family protein [Marinirhabdus gelatinilytica]RDK85251.1 small conductance mechanosensitive channel [Marinirhabdus gelatinilytica]